MSRKNKLMSIKGPGENPWNKLSFKLCLKRDSCRHRKRGSSGRENIVSRGKVVGKLRVLKNTKEKSIARLREHGVKKKKIHMGTSILEWGKQIYLPTYNKQTTTNNQHSIFFLCVYNTGHQITKHNDPWAQESNTINHTINTAHCLDSLQASEQGEPRRSSADLELRRQHWKSRKMKTAKVCSPDCKEGAPEVWTECLSVHVWEETTRSPGRKQPRGSERTVLSMHEAGTVPTPSWEPKGSQDTG